MTLVKNETHVADALGHLIEQFKNKPNIAAFITAAAQEIQELEDGQIQILTETTLANSIGQQLDNAGELVGEERFGRSDAQYRTAISARIQLNLSEGTIEDIIGLILALEPTLIVQIVEQFPAAFVAEIVNPIDPTQVDINQIASIIREGRPVGVRGLVQFGVVGSKQFDTAGVGFDLGKFGVVVEA